MVPLQCLVQNLTQLLLGESGTPPDTHGLREGGLHGLTAPGIHLLFGDLGDHGPPTLPGQDETLVLQVLVGALGGDDAAGEVVRQRPDGGQLCSRLELACQDEVPQLRLDLSIHRLWVLHGEAYRDTRPSPRVPLLAHAGRSLVGKRRTVAPDSNRRATPPIKMERPARSVPWSPCTIRATLPTRPMYSVNSRITTKIMSGRAKP